MLTLWTPRRIWIASIALVVVLGYAAGILHGPAAVWLAAIAFAAVRLRTSTSWLRVGWIVVTAILGVSLGLHLLPGFSNPLALDAVVLARDPRPDTQYVNFDKTLAGVLFLGGSGCSRTRR